jgi:hypothetical protein
MVGLAVVDLPVVPPYVKEVNAWPASPMEAHAVRMEIVVRIIVQIRHVPICHPQAIKISKELLRLLLGVDVIYNRKEDMMAKKQIKKEIDEVEEQEEVQETTAQEIAEKMQPKKPDLILQTKTKKHRVWMH